MTEFFCQACQGWYQAANCEVHQENFHNRKGMTMEALRRHMSYLGGLETREVENDIINKQPATPIPDPVAPPQSNWLWRDEQKRRGTFKTANFEHDLDE